MNREIEVVQGAFAVVLAEFGGDGRLALDHRIIEVLEAGGGERVVGQGLVGYLGGEAETATAVASLEAQRRH